jgi:hypothetical protein
MEELVIGEWEGKRENRTSKREEEIKKKKRKGMGS